MTLGEQAYWFRRDTSYRRPIWTRHIVRGIDGVLVSLCGKQVVSRWGCLLDVDNGRGIQGKRGDCKLCARRVELDDPMNPEDLTR
jgi:hypothetical protein